MRWAKVTNTTDLLVSINIPPFMQGLPEADLALPYSTTSGLEKEVQPIKLIVETYIKAWRPKWVTMQKMAPLVRLLERDEPTGKIMPIDNE